MLAIRVHEHGGPEVLRYADVSVPKPGPGEMRIHVEAAGVNFIDVYHRKGLYPIERPYTPGGEAAGVVREIGPGVTGFSIGDPVVSMHVKGAYAEMALAAASHTVRIPHGVGTKQAAAVFLQGITAHYLSHSTYPIKPGDRVLVLA